MVNVSQTFIPLFLLVTLHAPKSTIATVPLTVFGAGLVSTCVCERLTRRLGSEGLTFVGCVTVLLSCVGTFFIPASSSMSPYVYVIAVLLGSGTGIVGVSALSLICDLVGDCCESGAFVYGAMSFSDKIANGVAIMVAEALTPISACDGADDFQGGSPCLKVTAEEESYYRWVMIIAPGGSAIVASLMLAFILLTKHRRGLAAFDSASIASSASSAFSAPNQAGPCGPCSPHEWDHTTASAMQGVRGVVVNSPLPGRDELVEGSDEAERTELTPLLSASYKG
jgi:Na+/melibiose symporter-like transporter